jgi:hypothetical protein
MLCPIKGFWLSHQLQESFGFCRLRWHGCCCYREDDRGTDVNKPAEVVGAWIRDVRQRSRWSLLRGVAPNQLKARLQESLVSAALLCHQGE